MLGVIFFTGYSIRSPDQLVEARTVLEKIRPIDQKLKYQVEKLVKTGMEGKVESDPLRFKANPDNLEVRLLIKSL